MSELTHQCPAPGCKRRVVPDHRLSCPVHWFQLSSAVRSEVWRTYRTAPGSQEHHAAIASARAEWRELAEKAARR